MTIIGKFRSGTDNGSNSFQSMKTFKKGCRSAKFTSDNKNGPRTKRIQVIFWGCSITEANFIPLKPFNVGISWQRYFFKQVFP